MPANFRRIIILQPLPLLGPMPGAVLHYFKARYFPIQEFVRDLARLEDPGCPAGDLFEPLPGVEEEDDE